VKRAPLFSWKTRKKKGGLGGKNGLTYSQTKFENRRREKNGQRSKNSLSRKFPNLYCEDGGKCNKKRLKRD